MAPPGQAHLRKTLRDHSMPQQGLPLLWPGAVTSGELLVLGPCSQSFGKSDVAVTGPHQAQDLEVPQALKHVGPGDEGLSRIHVLGRCGGGGGGVGTHFAAFGPSHSEKVSLEMRLSWPQARKNNSSSEAHAARNTAIQQDSNRGS